MKPKSPTTSTNIALIGAGYIANWHADAIKAVSGVKLVAVCDTSLAAAEALAQAHGAVSFGDVDELLAANICDAVHILTPPTSHESLAVKCLQAGCDVVIEKPVAVSLSETKSILKAAKSNGKKVAASHNFLGIPSYKRLKNLKESGQLGRISTAEINWHLPLAPLRSGPFGLWMLAEPGNLLLELGPHLFAFIIDLFGAPRVQHLKLSKPVNLPEGFERAQSFQVLASVGDVDVTVNISLVETVDDRSVILRGSGGVARLDYAADTLVVSRDNTSDIVVNPLRRQLSLAAQDVVEGVVNATRQGLSLNQNGPYALGFQGVVGGVYGDDTSVDPRFNAATMSLVMTAIDDTLKLMPQENKSKKIAQKTPPKPTVLVIGGTGFIGRHLTRTLVAQGHDVRVLSRGKTGPFSDIADQVETFSTSLKDPEGLKAAMTGIRQVFHLAKSVDTSWGDCLKNDVAVTEGIASAALDAGVERFIYTGTIASYDMSDPTVTITETSGFANDMTDRNLYARSKAECEARLLILNREKGLPLSIARPGIVVGAGGPLQHWGIGRWHGAGAVRIWGDGRNILPFVLIQDVCDGLIRMMENPKAIGQSFNLVGEPMMNARDYFDAIEQSLGARIDVKSGPLFGYFVNDMVKFALKKHILRRGDIERASYRDWKSRAHFSPFEIGFAKTTLDWRPEADRAEFIRKAVTEANLFGF